MINRIFQEGVFRVPVHVIAGCPGKKFVKIVKKYYKTIDVSDITPDEHTTGLCHASIEPDQVVFLVWVEDLEDLKTLNHECTHLAMQILKFVSMDFDDGGEETLAHYRDFWFTILCDAFEKTVKRDGGKA